MVIDRDVRHLRPIPSRSLPDTEPIPDKDRLGLFPMPAACVAGMSVACVETVFGRRRRHAIFYGAGGNKVRRLSFL